MLNKTITISKEEFMNKLSNIMEKQMDNNKEMGLSGTALLAFGLELAQFASKVTRELFSNELDNAQADAQC